MEKVYECHDVCCGCGICMTICPKHAITMITDEKGFVYPEIDNALCVNCGACRNVCRFEKRKNESVGNGSSICYAACNVNEKELRNSASGGVFSAVANSFLKRGGAVVGVCMEMNEGKAHVFHTIIDSEDDLFSLQGSKYVQSHLWECVDNMELLLKTGKEVLFSGTPCQVDAVKSRFKKYIGTQLFTIDIICHGVPSQNFFNSFLEEYQRRNAAQLKSITFRDKKYGWGLKGQLVLSDNNTKELTKNDFSYYKLFLDGEIYRDSCYGCPYACVSRVGDITIGDYWGVNKYDPQVLLQNGGIMDFEQGISCLIVNGIHGEKLLERYGENIKKEQIDIQHVMQINKQLREPAVHTRLREKIFAAYSKRGYVQVERLFQRQHFYRNIKSKIKMLIKR